MNYTLAGADCDRIEQLAANTGRTPDGVLASAVGLYLSFAVEALEGRSREARIWALLGGKNLTCDDLAAELDAPLASIQAVTAKMIADGRLVVVDHEPRPNLRGGARANILARNR